MQFKKQFNTILAIVSLTISIISCKKDFLDGQDQTGVLLREDYVVDLKTTNEYLNGAYADLATKVFLGYRSIYPELIADNIKPILGSSGSASMLNFYKWSQSADNLNVDLSTAANANSISYDCYKQIRYANFIIESSEKYKNENLVQAKIIKGQALALRGYSKFLLLNIFCQPYNFTSDASHPGIVLFSSWDPLEQKLSRSSVKESYQSIIDDLQSAIDILDAGSFDRLAFSRLSAMALLSRVYLYSNDFTKAKDYAVAVIKEVPLMGIGYPDKLFTPESTESLLELPPAGFANGYVTQFASFFFRGRREFNATSDIANLLTEDVNDKRGSWVTQSDGAWQITKYPIGVVAGAIIPEAGYYEPIIRSSELYLTASESYFELDKTDSAIYYLDAIRLRANAQALPTSSSGNDLKDLIFKERRKELAFEGQRMFDLLRWKKNVIRQDVLTGGPTELVYGSKKEIAPISTIDVDGMGIQQNEGY